MEPSTRKVVTRSPSHTVRLLHLPHVQVQPIEADSSLERDFVQIAGLYPLIKSIQHQPFKLSLEESKYTPDFLLCFLDGSKLVVEVKPLELLAPHEPKLQAASLVLADAGLSFLVATDSMIRADGLASRAMRIRRYAKTITNKEITDQLLSLLERNPAGIQVSEVMQQLDLTQEVIFHALCHHRICTRDPIDLTPQAVLIDLKKFRNEVECDYPTYAIHFGRWFDPSRRDDNDRTGSTAV